MGLRIIYGKPGSGKSTYCFQEISKLINAYKSASSRLIKKEYPVVRNQLWKEYFWSKSYCLLTTGEAPIEIMKKYKVS